MSKNNGSITPRTIRHKMDLPLDLEVLEGISQYYGRFQAQYMQRNQDRLEVPKRKDFNIRKLDELSKYCDSGRLKGLKSQFSKEADAILKTPEVYEVIKSDQIVTPLEFMTIFQHRQDDRVTNFDPLKPTVRHYGINSTNSAMFIGHVIEEESLHPVEVSVFNKALSYLKKQCSAEEYIDIRDGVLSLPKPNNVVLVSFFPRKSEVDKLLKAKTIVADEKSPIEVETHTIALWKIGPKKITIIDPSDRMYSQFLTEVLNKTYPYTFQMEDSVVQGVEGNIYRPKHSAPKLLELARDCTDIAVKIAFELNEKQTDHSISFIDIMLTATIEQISNTNLPKEIGLFRAPQASDSDIRLAAKALIQKAKDIGVKLENSDAILKALDITKIENLDQIQEISVLIGELNTDLLI